MIHVIATIELNPGTREEFLKHFHAIVPLVHQEAGCLEYGPTVDVATDIAAQAPLRENVVVVVEKWESVDALKAHLVAPHMQEYREKVKSLVKGMTLHILQPA